MKYVIIIRDNVVHTTLYHKPTSVDSTLRAESFHPGHVIKNLGEYIRARRMCSTQSDYARETNMIDQRLALRGYFRKFLSRAKNIANSKDREHYLYADNDRKCNTKRNRHSNTETTTGQDSPIFVTTYSTKFDQITNIIKNICTFIVPGFSYG